MKQMKSMATQLMSEEKPSIRGKRGFQKLSRAMQRKTYGTLTRREYFGRLYPIVVLHNRGRRVMEVRRARNG